MMEYEIFKAVVEDNFKDFLPQAYKDAKLECHKVMKTNQTLDAIGVNVNGMAPTIYVNDLYQEYQQVEDWQSVVKAAAERVVQGLEGIPDCVKQIDVLKDPEYVKTHIISSLMNTEKNRGYLSNIPHRDFSDLSVTYHIIVDGDSKIMASTVVTNTMADSLDFTEKDLYAYAAANNKSLLKPFVMDLGRLIQGSCALEYTGENGLDELEPHGINVIRNKPGLHGANVMLDEEFLSKVAEKYGSDYYILPSSIHEVITISTDFGMGPEELRQMVTEVNADVVEAKDFLSDSVYRYDRELQQVVVA